MSAISRHCVRSAAEAEAPNMPASPGRIVRGLLCNLAIALSLTVPPRAQAAETVGAPLIGSVSVTGNRSVDADTITSALTFKAGEPWSSAAAANSIRQLFATGLFADVRITPGRAGSITVAVVENPRIAAVVFEGNAAVETKKLVETVRFKRGGIYSRARARSDEIKLRDLYRAEGRYRTTITSRTKQGETGVTVTFVIAEGEINKVVAIGFTGNRAYSASALRDVITTTQSGWLDILKSNLTYDPERLTVDRLLLRRHYLTHGFVDATVGEAKVGIDPKTGNFDIVFPIDEGERFTFAAPSVDSRVPGIATTELHDKLTTRQGAPYAIDKIEASTESISTALAIGGQPFARVSAQIERDEMARTIKVAYRIEEGPHVFIRRIEISGNVRTRDHVVRRELRIADGDPFTPPLIQAARKRLMGTGFFKSVEIRPAKTDNIDRVDLQVAVLEQETGELSFGIGYSLTDGVIGDVAYADRNVLGTGYAMKIKLEAGQKRYGAEIGVTDPHFLDSYVAAGFDLFYRDVDRTLQSSYKQQRYGGTLRLGIPVTDTVSSGLSYTFQRNTLHEVGPDASAAIKEAAAFGGGSYNTSAIGTSTTYDTRNSRRAPTTGILATASQDLAGVGGDTCFIRTTADVRAYVPLVDGVTFVGRIGGGTISGYGGQDVRLLDLFYKGGDTVRGFATAGLGPRDALSANQDALGGKSFYVTSAELRTPVPFISPSLGLSALVFADAGSVFGANTTAAKLPGLAASSAAPRASTGVGLVWDSPVGPLQASYGFVLSKQPGDKVQPFNFGVGSGF